MPARFFEWDRRLSNRVAAQGRSRWGRVLAHVLSRSGDSWLWLILAAALWASGYPLGSRLFWVAAVTALVNTLLKLLFRRRRPRPGTINIAGDQFAFPSGHAARAAAVAATVTGQWPTLAPFLLVWAVAVAYARVMRSAHFMFDVFAGLLVGLGVSVSLHRWLF